MAISAKLLLAGLGSAVLLAGCATGPYYDGYGYNDPYNRGYVTSYDYGYPGYYSDYPYVAPGLGVGLGYSYTYIDRDRRHGHWRDRREWRDRDDRREWRDRRPEFGAYPSRQEQIDRGIIPPDNFRQDHGQYSPG